MSILWGPGCVLGMLLNGLGIQERDAKGEEVRGDTLLVLFNGGHEDQTITLPRWRHAVAWTRVIDTNEPDGQPLHLDGGSPWVLTSRSSAIWRANPT